MNPTRRARVRILIIGSGFGGLGAALRLRADGHDDITILERASTVGGTWRDNTYPGAACDIPSHLYSLEVAANPDWSRAYPRQPEIQAYLERLTDERDLRRLIRFDREVTSAVFDEATTTWTVTTSDGEVHEADVLISAIGALKDPAFPDIAGRETFAGPQMHSSRWDHTVELTGKRVGVVGTGASAIQFVPEIASDAAEVHLFQRTPPWIIPRRDRPYLAVEKWLFRRFPRWQRLYRALMYWRKESRFGGFTRDNPFIRVMQLWSRLNMARSIRDPQLRRALTPDYQMGCKRILISNDYYPALARPNVAVHTGGVDRITPTGVVTGEGEEVDVDVLIYGTGFTVHDPLGDMDVRGRGGRVLGAWWGERPSAYLGITVPGFPNLYLIGGPNTGTGHQSVIHMAESAFEYVADAIRLLQSSDTRAFDLREDVHDRFVAEMDERSAGMVWTSGCASWYLANGGVNYTLWPAPTYEYRRRTRRFDVAAYTELAPMASPAVTTEAV